MDQRLAQLRREYEALGLVEEEMADDPLTEFDLWFSAVVGVGLEEPNAFVLATADEQGRPSARAVLMKDYDEAGIVFYTNMGSRKSGEMQSNPWAAATFVWVPLHRQIRFEGGVAVVGAEQSDRYFATRPRGARIAAHASPQSAVVESRRVLEDAYRRAEAEFQGRDVPRPPTWGGWRLRPDVVEFWQGQPDRFHDRVRYVRRGSGWRKERLAP